jgi:trehalose 6-phosphate phosphatase
MTEHWTHSDALVQILRSPHLGVICDFDGTLSPFVTDPSTAEINPDSAAALDELHEQGILLALVSGRRVEDLRSRFMRPYLTYFGNHGMEYWNGETVLIVEPALPWQLPLQDLLEHISGLESDGVLIENKGITATIHYRDTEDPSDMRHYLRSVLMPLAKQYGFVMGEGQYIWELKPPIDIHKGTALAAIIAAQELNAVIFMGDDVTDINAMKTLHTLRAQESVQGVSIGVLHPTGSPPNLAAHADAVAHGVLDVAKLLWWVAEQKVSSKEF